MVLPLLPKSVNAPPPAMPQKSASGPSVPQNWGRPPTSHLSVVQYLCEEGPDKEARNDIGGTPLLWAAFNGHLSVVPYLVFA